MDPKPAASLEARYSRQIYAVGAGAMRRMLQARVAVVGLGSTGSELAKNVLLSGCPCVGLYDDTPVAHPRHTESNFFIPRGTAAVGTPRAAAVLPALTPLNSTASVTLLADADTQLVSSGACAAAAVVAFRATVVALCDPLAIHGWTADDIADFTASLRAHGIPVVVAETYGVFCRIFDDFGEAFVVEDAVGEDPAVFPVTTMEPVAEALATLKVVVDVNDHMLPVVAGDRVRLSCGELDVAGTVSSRAGSDTVVIVQSGDAVQGSKAALEAWAAVAMAPGAPRVALREHRVPATIAHQPWAAVLGPNRTVAPADEPQTLSMTRDNTASATAFAARHRHGYDDVVADVVAALGEETGTNFIATMDADVVGMAAFVGGVASQEVLKAATGRLVPITQCWYYDFREIIVGRQMPKTPAEQKLAEAMPSHAAVFGGGAAVDRFRNADIFVVGAGAIGCEYLKNLALMGAGTGPKGRITVSDMDSIEVSNLSRQFLFREQHVGHNKALTAAESIKAVFGPRLKVRALQEKVSAETAHPATGIFNKRFWSQCSMVCTAVDNVAAREFLDDCAASYKKPMVDSGTQAARGHVEVFAPHLTARFRDAAAPADAGKAVPFCTLHFFPTTIEHCVQFATDLFAGQFSSPPENANRCVFEHPDVDAYAASLDRGVRLQNLRSVYATLCESKPASWRDACAWARGLFETVFVFPPRQLLLSYPVDKTDADGKPYWTGSKRPPTVPVFNLNGDALHRAFIVSAAAVLCRVHGVQPPSNVADAELAAAVDAAELPVFVPKAVNADVASTDDPGDAAKGTTVEEDIARAEARAAEDAAEQAELVRRISEAAAERRAKGAKLNPEVFEKDDEGNSHVEFVSSVANIRATAYGIPTSSDMDVKRIAGRIVPAMITTTAVVTGLATLQACRLLAVGPDKNAAADAVWASALKGAANTSVNLADTNFTQSFDPSPPVRKPFFVRQQEGTSAVALAASPTFTTWDELSIDDRVTDPTIGQVIEHVAAKYHGIGVLQIVEASRNAWVYDAAALSGDAPKELGFPIVGWTQRLLGLSDDEVAAMGKLSFVLRCAPPASVTEADAAAAVSASLPPLVVHV